jgi:hypothetical protein
MVSPVEPCVVALNDMHCGHALRRGLCARGSTKLTMTGHLEI